MFTDFIFFFLEVCFHIGNHQIAITVLLESNWTNISKVEGGAQVPLEREHYCDPIWHIERNHHKSSIVQRLGKAVWDEWTSIESCVGFFFIFKNSTKRNSTCKWSQTQFQWTIHSLFCPFHWAGTGELDYVGQDKETWPSPHQPRTSSQKEKRNFQVAAQLENCYCFSVWSEQCRRFFSSNLSWEGNFCISLDWSVTRQRQRQRRDVWRFPSRIRAIGRKIAFLGNNFREGLLAAQLDAHTHGGSLSGGQVGVLSWKVENFKWPFKLTLDSIRWKLTFFSKIVEIYDVIRS